MEQEQYRRVVSAIQYTINQLRNGPTKKEQDESVDSYEVRIESWYRTKQVFCLYAIRCLKAWDKQRAEEFLMDLRQLGDDI